MIKSTAIDKRSIVKGRKEQRLDLSEAISDVHTRCGQCGFTFSCNDINSHTGGTKSSIAYCRHCGQVASKAIGSSVVKELQEQHNVKEQLTADTTTMPFLGSIQESSDLTARSWITQSKASDQTEKNFAICLGEVTRLVQALSLQPVLASKAADLCMMAFEKGITKGASLSVLSAAIVYASARLASVPVTVDEVTVATKLARSDIIYCFRRMQRKLGLEFEVPSPEAHVTKIIALLSITPDSELIIAANKIIRLADEGGRIQGKNPAAVAAAAIYLALSRTANNSSSSLIPQLTQRKLAQAANVTETTIRRACRNLDQYL
jgi:transcription initiation factor TFIIIB Brf1 subunit/transcription initiation factor TFIIB